ncbi:MAG: GNAT family N-acetyltransferase [bacterium]
MTRCDVVCPVPESQWLDHLRNVEAYTFFHTPRWCHALCRFDHRFRDSTVLIHLDETVVLLPLVAVRKSPFIETLESMPWGTYGGWVTTRSLTEDEERQCVRSLLSIRRPQISIVSWPGTGVLCRPDRLLNCETHRLDLTSGFEHIWDHCYAPRHRTKIRKAQRSGLEAIIDNSVEGIRAYKDLYKESMKRWEGDLAFDPDFLDEWIDAPPEEVSLWLCRRQGEALAGMLMFYSPVEAHYWSGASDKDSSEFHPNNFLASCTVEDAVKRGCRTYNFASSAGLPGVIQFKEQFGPDVIPYTRSAFLHPLWRPLGSLARRVRR